MGTKEKIKAALKAATTFRGSKPDLPTLTLYSNRLSQENEQDVLAALEKLAEMPRGEYESALPDIGTMLRMVEVCKIARDNRSNAKKSERLVRWECPSCHSVQSGFPSVNADLDRRCYRKITSAQGEELQCGAQMQVTFDEHEGGNLGGAHGVAKWEAPEWVNK